MNPADILTPSPAIKVTGLWIDMNPAICRIEIYPASGFTISIT